jgi:polyketide biosynthesis enoyl-CoA hydratase PksI
MSRYPCVERHSREIAILRVASDEEPYLTTDMVGRFTEAAEAIANDAEVRAVLVQGGQRHFSAGAKLEELAASAPEQQVTSYVAAVPRAILSIPVPTIAVMEGHAIGGGLIMGLWCDMAVLAAESLYGANFMALGFTPGMGATSVVLDSFGGPLGREMLITGRMLKGREIAAANVPLSTSVVQRAEVHERAMETAQTIAAMARRPLELLELRLKEPRIRALEEALSSETRMHTDLFSSDATRSRIEANYTRGGRA